MTAILEDRPVPKEARRQLRPWQARLGLGAVLLAVALLASGSPPSAFCPKDLRDVTAEDYQQTSDVICDSPIVGTWRLTELKISGSPSALPHRWDGGTGGTLTFLPDGTLNGRLCNSFATHFQVSETRLRTSEVVRIPVGCPARQERVEGIVISALRYADAEFTVSVAEPGFNLPGAGNWDGPSPLPTSDQITLTVTSGETMMVFEAMDD
jgi:hypothetical protein